MIRIMKWLKSRWNRANGTTKRYMVSLPIAFILTMASLLMLTFQENGNIHSGNYLWLYLWAIAVFGLFIVSLYHYGTVVWHTFGKFVIRV